MALHFCVFCSLKNSELGLIIRKTSDKSKLGTFRKEEKKTVKFGKDKDILRHCHSQKEAEETE